MKAYRSAIRFDSTGWILVFSTIFKTSVAFIENPACYSRKCSPIPVRSSHFCSLLTRIERFDRSFAPNNQGELVHLSSPRSALPSCERTYATIAPARRILGLTMRSFPGRKSQEKKKNKIQNSLTKVTAGFALHNIYLFFRALISNSKNHIAQFSGAISFTISLRFLF